MMSCTARRIIHVVYNIHTWRLSILWILLPPPSYTHTHAHTQEKRSIFPRFYFVGDDDLLEILGQATNPNVIQTHLKKLFAGIHTVEFEGEEETKRIVAMRSLEGEVVPLKEPVPISADVEVRAVKLILVKF